MSFDAEKLYELLPTVHRLRDVDQGKPLAAFLRVVAEQIGVLEEDLAQLYDDQFIETCAPWVAPYIGDLVGYRPLHGVVPEVASPRAEVANTIAYRRRKGTATVLEQLARDVTGWDARAVEFFQLLGWTQHMNHLRPDHHYAPNLRRWEPLERLGGPFESTAHTVGVRRISRGAGKYNIPNVGLFLWRLENYPLTESPALRVDDRRYLVSPLGLDVQLFTFPETETEISQLATPRNVAHPISRRVLHENLDAYYGVGKSILLRVGNTVQDIADIKVCDLSDDGADWAHQPANRIAIDPVLGRIAFPENQPPPPPEVFVSFHYGFSADMGGGEYERGATLSQPLANPVEVTAPASIQPALTANGGVVEITDSGRYEENLSIQLNAQRQLELRARNEHRPTLVLGADFEIRGDAEAEVTLNGLLITGGRLRVPDDGGNQLRRLRLRHCTLEPGVSGLDVELAGVTVEIESSIVGTLRIHERSRVEIRDSIVDATDETQLAFAAADPAPASPPTPGAELVLENVTVIGQVHTRLLELASNCIFAAALDAADSWASPLRSERKQAGCVRFSYLPDGARVPRRYRCQPDLAIHQAIQEASKKDPMLTNPQKASIAETVRARVMPRFTDLRYGRAAYAQLHVACPQEIRAGADDESEMGAFHDNFAPQRETNLRLRLDEYLRFGLEAGIFYAT